MGKGTLLQRNPSVVIRNDFNDFAVLFNPLDGKAFGLNPVGEVIWKLLETEHTVESLISQVSECCEDIPGHIEQDVLEFLEQLERNGLVGRSS